MVLDFVTNKDKIFTPLYYRLKHCKSRFLINYGSAGSAKSYSQAQNELMHSLRGPEKILVIRKVGTTLKDSVVPLFIDEIIPKWNLGRLFTYNKTDRELENKVNGSKIIFRGLDDPEKIKSIQGITRIWIEEATELEEEDFNQLNIRIRGREHLQISLTLNPIIETHWIKKRFFDGDVPNTTVFHTTYQDNPFIDEEYKRQMEWYRINNYEYYRVYGLGQWGRLQTGNEFYSKFDAGKFVKPTAYLPGVPVHLSFDFNVLPYLSLLCCQIARNGNKVQVRFYKEYPMRPPDNTIESAAIAFSRDHPDNHHNCWYYGDASGKARQPGYGDKRAFDDVELFFRKYFHNASDRVARRNPGVFKRRDFINNIFLGAYDIEISIDPSCKELIKDLEQTKTGEQGKIKKRVLDKVLDATYEQLGHYGDCFDYVIVELFSQIFNK